MMSGFQTLFDSLESKKHGLEVMLSELSPMELGFCPGPQRWSIQMILEHIIIMEEVIVREMEERLQNRSVEWDAKSPSSIRKLLFAMNKDVPVDIPSKELEPSGMSSMAELLSRW
ncbi:MAG: DinB family protein, partial [Desulfobacterales bacterium]|nr:DinB family protein [Desulfobacterales bacterium]